MRKNNPYFAPIANLPVIITKKGRYLTRSGAVVIIRKVSSKHDFNCTGYFATGGNKDKWHKSGRLYATVETEHDIIKKAR